MASPISLLAFTHEPVTFISALKGCSRWLTGIPKNLFCVGGFCPAKITALKTAAWSTRRSSISKVEVAFEDEGRPVTAGTGCEFVNWSVIILKIASYACVSALSFLSTRLCPDDTGDWNQSDEGNASRTMHAAIFLSRSSQ